MNPSSKLPNEIKGKWIWDSRISGKDCQHLLFRKDFLLTEMVGEAELWVATHAFFSIVVNGRYCMAGPIPHPGSAHSAYAAKVDIAHVLEVGVNRISILVHKENNYLSGVNNTIDGLWLQLDVDGSPIIWTEASGWATKTSDAFQDTGLLSAPCDVHTECIDLDKLGNSWMKTDASELLEDKKSGWRSPDFTHDISVSYCSLEPYEQFPLTTEHKQNPKIVFTGTVTSNCQIAWVSFHQAIPNIEVPGTFIAETFVWCESAMEQDCLLICDIPYILYMNGTMVKRQAVPKLVYRGPSASLSAGRMQPQDYEAPDMKMKFLAGWNHLMMVVECQTAQAGFSFIWPMLPDGSLKCYQKKQRQAGKGWTLAGPLNVPMVLVYPKMNTDELLKYSFIEEAKQPYDPAAMYYSRNFTAHKSSPEDYPVELNEGTYAIFDFGYVHYAYPSLQLSGKKGDVVDVICGEHLHEAEVLALLPGERRNMTTLILGEGTKTWQASTPRGFRYMMVVVRRADMPVCIENSGLWHENLDAQDFGEFSCSLPTLEQIWNIGRRTLQTTINRIYMDSPTGDQAQALPDAMIQSWSAYYVFGMYSAAEGALEAFAREQFDTGELNAASPSSLFQALPDYSLCWPVWLYRHYFHTGNKDFLMRMMPVLKKLMGYYNAIASYDNGPLADLQDYLGVYPFIDYGDFERRGISCALNGLYCRALLSSALLAEMVDMQELAVSYRERAVSVASKVAALLWNEDKQLYADSFIDGRQTEECSWQSNVLAIYGGIAKPRQYEAIWNQLFSENAPMDLMVSAENNNPYFKYYVLETAFALEKSQWALRYIHYYWGSMAKAGAKTWWETFDPTLDTSNSLRTMKHCNGYGVTPNAVLIRDLIGIRPAEPGMSMVYFNPTPGDVTWAKATIPTPQGSISVFWKLEEDGIFNVNISATYVLEVIPILEPGIADQAIFNVSDKVSIMAPEEE